MIKRLRASLSTDLTQTSILILVGMILRCWFIDKSPFWYDESFSALLARMPLDRMILATAGDVHPPLYYFMIHFWGMFAGFTTLGLRELSAVFSILTLWQIDVLCKSYNLDRRIRMTTLALAAFSPVLIYYAQEARMYAILTWLVLEIWIQIRARRWWLIGLLTVCLLYLHNYGLIYGACLGLLALGYALIKPRDRYEAGQPELKGTDIGPVLLSFGIPVLLYLPWFIYGLSNQLAMVNADYWLNHVSAMGQVLGTTSLLMGSRGLPGINILFGAVVVGLLIPVTVWLLKQRRLDWLLMALGPLLLAAGISLWRMVYLTRALTPLLPAIYLVMASFLWTTRWYQQLAVKVVIFGAITFGVFFGVTSSELGTTKYNPLVSQTDSYIKPGVPVIHIGDFTAVNWMASRPDVINLLYQSPCLPLPGELTPKTRANMGITVITADQLPSEYYLVPYVGNLSNKCQEDQYHAWVKGLKQITVQDLQYGETGVYYHAK